MNIIKKIHNILTEMIEKVAYSFASKKNIYTYVYIGEKENTDEIDNTFILFRKKGCSKIEELGIKNLLANEEIIEQFSQKDSLKFGIIAISNIFHTMDKGIEKKFQSIRKKMLIENSTAEKNLSNKNYYPYKFSGYKEITKNNYTTILYTERYKREIFEYPVNEFANNYELLEKFHPTFAVKVGAIYMGEYLLSLKNKNKLAIQQSKQKIMSNLN